MNNIPPIINFNFVLFARPNPPAGGVGGVGCSMTEELPLCGTGASEVSLLSFEICGVSIASYFTVSHVLFLNQDLLERRARLASPANQARQEREFRGLSVNIPAMADTKDNDFVIGNIKYNTVIPDTESICANVQIFQPFCICQCIFCEAKYEILSNMKRCVDFGSFFRSFNA